MHSEYALSIKNLCYSYHTDWLWKKITALHDISFDVKEGEAFGFLGHNGAGKTTTIKCILRLIKPARGSIHIFGVPSEQTSARTSVGYLPEQPYFYDHLTVAELMSLYGNLLRLPRATLASSIKLALERVGLNARGKSPLRALSKGLVQRVAMAQAILAKPRLLILDEPFSGLDPIGRKEFRDLLLDLKAGGATIFMSSHILNDVEFICDRASILLHGELKGVFEIRDIPRFVSHGYELIVRNFKGVETEIKALAGQATSNEHILRATFSNQQAAEQALRLALHGGCAIESYQLLHGGLEEVFFQTLESDAPQHNET